MGREGELEELPWVGRKEVVSGVILAAREEGCSKSRETMRYIRRMEMRFSGLSYWNYGIRGLLEDRCGLDRPEYLGVSFLCVATNVLGPNRRQWKNLPLGPRPQRHRSLGLP